MRIELSKTELNMLLYLCSEIKKEADVLQVFDERIKKESFDNLYLKLANYERSNHVEIDNRKRNI